MSPAEVHTIDTFYTGRPELAAAYLIEGGEGAAFVETNTTGALPRLLAALDAHGLEPAQVRYVIITHIHLDHAGGAGALMAACENATLLAHPRAAPHAIDPTRIVAGAKKVYGDARFDELYGEIVPVPEARVRVVEDEEEIDLGARPLRFLHTRGHANHHFCIHDLRAEAVFTGDAFGLLYPSLQRNGVLALPSTTPTDFDAPAARASVERIRASGATRVFPTHFGVHTDIDGAAAALDRQLEAYGEIVDEGDHSGREGEELDEFCLARTRELMRAQLEQRGLASDADALAQIELDTELNAQGLAFAVRKRRYKRSQAQAR
jgi:glyoxylase-like metal-dependent hydrolase (beta-lactamase superfamily II)